MPEKLKRLSLPQRTRCNRLIRKLCANYDDGNCLLLDYGETCVCPQTISFSLLCRYFLEAVLPADKELYADIFRGRACKCTRCGKNFVPASNRQKYCKPCAKRIHQEQKNNSKRRNKETVRGSKSLV